MITIRWLLDNEGRKSEGFRNALRAALNERLNDPRLTSTKLRERADADVMLRQVQEIADRNGVSPEPNLSAVSRPERTLMRWITEAINEKAARENRHATVGPETRPEFAVEHAAQLLVSIDHVADDVLMQLEFT